jgi:hypothetical protein
MGIVLLVYGKWERTETREYMGSKSLIVWLAMTRKINSIAMAHLICYIMWQ